MKRVLGMGLAGLLLAMATEAQAAPDPKDWKLEIRVDNQLSATAVLKGTAKADDSYKFCRVGLEKPLAVKLDNNWATTADWTNLPERSLVEQAVTQKQVQCTTEGDASKAQKWDVIPVSIEAPKGTIYSPTPLFSEQTSIWLDSWAQAAIDKLGGVKSCKVFPGKFPTKDEKELGTCTPSLSRNQLSLGLSEKLSRGRLEVTLNDGKTVLQIAIETCLFQASGSIPVIVAGATSQRLSLAPISADNSPICLGNMYDVTTLVSGDFKVEARPKGQSSKTSTDDFYPSSMLLENIPATLPVGVQEFKIVGRNGSVGTAKIEVVPPIQADKKIAVVYDLSILKDPEVEKYRAFFQGTTLNEGGVAVENPLAKEDSDRLAITNTVTVQISPKIPNPQLGIWRTLDSSDQKESGSTELVWGVGTGDRKLSFRDVSDLHGDSKKNATNTYQVLDNGPEKLTFDVPAGLVGPIHRKMALLEVIRSKSASSEGRVEPILEVDVTLAEKTRRESVPLPIHDLLEVSCNEKVTSIGHAYSATSDDLKINACKLEFPKKDPKAQNAPQTPWDRIPTKIRQLFGPQRIAVKVKGASANGDDTIWPAQILADDTTIPLKTNVTNAAIAGVYEIEGRIVATHDDRTHYRGQTAESVALAADPRFAFKATVRPRDTVDFKGNWRLYMTAFVPVTGLRIGAAAPELKSSTDYTNFQLVEPKLGLLLGAEPFTHARGKNTWPTEPSLQLGMNLVSLANGGFAPTFLVGGAATIPYIDDVAAKIRSKVTLGAYYEFDPRVSDRYAHHFLLTLGLNVGTLLSSSNR